VGTNNPNEKLTVEGAASLRAISPPSATANYGKLYVDSSDANKLKYKDPAGSVFDLTASGGGVVTFPLSPPAGTVSAPSYSFSGDPGTGIYSTGVSQVSIASGGNPVVDIGTSGVQVTGSVGATGHVIGASLKADFDDAYVYATSSGTEAVPE